MNREAHYASIVENYLAAFNAKDWKQMLGYLGPDVVHDINQGETERGVGVFQEFLERMNRCYDERLTDIVLMAHANGRVAAEFVVNGRYLQADAGLPPARGQKYVLPAGAFYQIDSSDKIARVTMYYNLSKWLQLVQ